MKRTVKIVVGVAACALVFMAAGLAFAESFGDGNDVTGPAAEKARAAAIQAVPGGTVGKVEQETGEAPGVVYGVAVTKPDGTKVEVHQDQNFHVLGIVPAGWWPSIKEITERLRR
jgi:hypothetical protein